MSLLSPSIKNADGQRGFFNIISPPWHNSDSILLDIKFLWHCTCCLFFSVCLISHFSFCINTTCTSVAHLSVDACLLSFVSSVCLCPLSFRSYSVYSSPARRILRYRWPVGTNLTNEHIKGFLIVFWTPIENPMFKKTIVNTCQSAMAITHSMLVLPVSFTHELVQTELTSVSVYLHVPWDPRCTWLNIIFINFWRRCCKHQVFSRHIVHDLSTFVNPLSNDTTS